MDKSAPNRGNIEDVRNGIEKDSELEEEMNETRSKKFYLVYWLAVVAVFALVIGMIVVAPNRAHAAELAAGQADLTTQATKTVEKATVAKKVVNPYRDVIAGKTVDKIGWRAVKYVKAHKGFSGVITGKRFYPTKRFSEAQFTKILSNLYGNKVALSKSKTAVTGKYATAKLQSVAKNVFGVKIKWKSGNGAAKLSRTGVANYVRTFATWDGGLFAPKQ